jgi:hypothetical protein
LEKNKILIGICRKSGDHPYEDDEDLAKSGYKTKYEVGVKL